MTIGGIVLSILCSVIASFMFWIFTFLISGTKVKFAEHIEKSPDIYGMPDRYRYRMKFVNAGRRDLLEVTCIVRLIVKGEYTNNNSYIKLGNYDVLPVLVGNKWRNKNSVERCAWMLPIEMTDAAYRGFTKEVYPEHIQTAAKDKTLTIGDVLKEFNPNSIIIIYIFGYDAVTGARRKFQSKPYSYTDIIAGKYNTPEQFKPYKDYIRHTLEITPQNFSSMDNKEADIKKNSEVVGDTSEKNKKK